MQYSYIPDNRAPVQPVPTPAISGTRSDNFRITRNRLADAANKISPAKKSKKSNNPIEVVRRDPEMIELVTL